MLLAFSGVVGLWGIGFFSFDLIRTGLPPTDFEAAGARPTRRRSSSRQADLLDGDHLAAPEPRGVLRRSTPSAGSRATSAASRPSPSRSCWRWPRRPSPSGSSTSFYDIFWMIPIMGFCQLALFGGYAIYFPELFPTRLRSTGTSFCYNVGRLVAAAGPLDPRPADERGLRRLQGDRRRPAVPLRRRDDVPRLPDRPGRPALRPRDQGQAAAGVSRPGA